MHNSNGHFNMFHDVSFNMFTKTYSFCFRNTQCRTKHVTTVNKYDEPKFVVSRENQSGL